MCTWIVLALGKWVQLTHTHTQPTTTPSTFVPPLMTFVPFKLSKTVLSHSNDVRAVGFVNGQDIVSSSRDGTCVLTSQDGNSTVLVEGTSFLNSLSVDNVSKTVFVGSHDSSIIAVNLQTLAQTYYLGHEANVSCLDTINDGKALLASGSWDHTVRVWESPESSFALTGHTQNVWGVKFVSPTQLLSASADKTIKLWDLTSRKCVKTFTGHTDAVRAIALVSSTSFVSASNDGTLKFWNLEGGSLSTKTITGHSSFIYTLAVSENYIFSGGEDRTVHVWDKNSHASVQTIILPSISEWSVAVNPVNGDMAVGSSDNTARVFTQSDARVASLSDLELFEDAVKGTAIGESEIDESQVKDSSVLKSPGKQEGQVVIVRNGRQLEAHQYSNGVWSKLGDVVGKSQASGSKKETYNGKKYDYVFDVDIEDGQPPLKLPFNNSDNPYNVAEAFILENQLPTSYLQQVVQFLITNSQAKNFDSAPAPAASASTASPSTAGGEQSGTQPATGERYVPPAYSTLVPLKAFQAGPLLKALTQIAAKHGDDISKLQIDALLNSLPSSGSELLRVAIELSNKWKDDINDLLPVYDLLRVAIANAGSLSEQGIWVILLGTLDADIPKHCMLSIRGINNLIARPDFNPQSKVSSAMLGQAIDMIMALTTVDSPQLATKPFTVALATLVLNLAVHQITYLDYVPLIEQVAPKVAAAADDEALYRLALAVSLRLGINSAEGANYSSQWFKNGQQPRLVNLVNGMKPYLKQ